MRKSKLVLLLLLIVSLALFASGCDTLLPDQTPENGDTEDGAVTDPSYFVFNEGNCTTIYVEVGSHTDETSGAGRA
ncbi:MAG: hypothetical protein ABEJ25_05730 [Candidatus Bipolaricaulia bacterium]